MVVVLKGSIRQQRLYCSRCPPRSPRSRLIGNYRVYTTKHYLWLFCLSCNELSKYKAEKTGGTDEETD